MIQIQHLSFSYGRTPVLADLTFSAAPGECVVLCGPNGSGKSTALAIAAGILKPKGGTVSMEGRVGYVPQGTALFEDMTVEENFRFFAGLLKVPVPEELPFGIEAYRNQKVGKLSGGTKKRVSIACAMLGDPDILLLDEPSAGLDVLWQDELKETVRQLKERGHTVLYAGHDTAEYETFYDSLIFLGSGEPAYYTRAQLSGTSGDAYTESVRLKEAYRGMCAAG